MVRQYVQAQNMNNINQEPNEQYNPDKMFNIILTQF